MKQEIVPGELCHIVRAGHPAPCPGIIGRIVTAVRPVVYGEVFTALDGQRLVWHHEAPGWVIEAATPLPSFALRRDGRKTVHQFHQRAIAAAYLRPIRGGDGEDEMLRIAGRPNVLEVA